VIPALCVVVALAVGPMVPTVIIPVLVTTVIPVITMLCMGKRNALAVVPVVPHNQDPLAARVVFAAVLPPMFFDATRRYAQTDRRTIHRYLFDHNGRAVDYLRMRIVADVKVSIETRFANADGFTDIGAERRCGGQGCCE
jgi:hypothetical protein